MQDDISPSAHLFRALKNLVSLVVTSAAGIAAFIVIMFAVFVVIGWLVDVSFESRYPKDHPNSRELDAAGEVESSLFTAFGDSIFRVQIMQADNLNIYLEKKDFESIPFPDRSSVIKQISEHWCEDGRKLWLFPSVKFEDIRTGAMLVQFNCVTEGDHPRRRSDKPTS